MEHKVKTDAWIQAETQKRGDDDQRECRSTKQHETRCWDRTVFVPLGMQPIDIIQAYPFELPFPPFQAGQISVNQRDVECIASAMIDPNLRWRNMCHFVIAPYEGKTLHLPKRLKNIYSFDPEDYAGQSVLITGHHRFLAFLLCGLPPAELPPIQVRPAALAVTIFPWEIVEWGA